MQKNGVHRLDFDKLAHVIQYGLQEFIVNNIEGESTGQTILVSLCRSGSVAFSQNLILQKAVEIVPPMNEKLK